MERVGFLWAWIGLVRMKGPALWTRGKGRGWRRGTLQMGKGKCGRDISLVYNPPIGASFGPWNISQSLPVKGATTMLFCLDLQKSYYINRLQTLMLLFH